MLSENTIVNIAFLVAFLVLALILFASMMWCGRLQKNIHENCVIPIDPREPHSITITFVPIYPPASGTIAPAPTPAGVLRTARADHPSVDAPRGMNAPAA